MLIVRHAFRFTIGIVALCLSSPGRAQNPTPAVNLLINGSFEEPQLTADAPQQQFTDSGLVGWTVRGAVILMAASRQQPAPSSGDQSLILVDRVPGVISQSFATEPDHEYVLSGWMAHNNVNPNVIAASADVSLNGHVALTLIHTRVGTRSNNMLWQRFEHRFRATSSTTSLEIADTSGYSRFGGGMALDGLAVTPIEVYPSPPPLPSPPPENLLINGSFEEPNVTASPKHWGFTYGPEPNLGITAYGGPDIPGWRITRGTIDVLRLSWPAAVGLQSIDLTGSSGAARIEQSFVTQPGREYILSGYIFGLADVFIDGSFLTLIRGRRYFVPFRDDRDWSFFRVHFRATGAVTTLAISDIAGLGINSGSSLDGLSVTPADAVQPMPVAGTPPILPSHLVAQQADGQMVLTWDDNSDNETGFTIIRRMNLSTNWSQVGTVEANVTRFVDASAEPGVPYTYQLLVLDPAGGAFGLGEATAAIGPQPTYSGTLMLGLEDAGIVRHDLRTGRPVETFAGLGSYGFTLTAAMTMGPDGNLYATGGGQKVLRFNVRTGAYLGTLSLSWRGLLNNPRGMAFAPNGDLCVSEYDTSRVLRFDSHTGAFLGVLVPKARGGLEHPTDLLFGPGGNLYVFNTGTSTILRYDGQTGAVIGPLTGPGSNTLGGAGHMTFGPDGNLYATSIANNSVLRFSPTTGAVIGTFIRPGTGGLMYPRALAFDPDGNLWVDSKQTGQIYRFDGRTGNLLDVFLVGAPEAILFVPPLPDSTPGQLSAPEYLGAALAAPVRVRLTWNTAVPSGTGIGVWRRPARGNWVRIGDGVTLRTL
jgi:DNA-binding beta-propeller fold protein YncE